MCVPIVVIKKDFCGLSPMIILFPFLLQIALERLSKICFQLAIQYNKEVMGAILENKIKTLLSGSLSGLGNRKDCRLEKSLLSIFKLHTYSLAALP